MKVSVSYLSNNTTNVKCIKKINNTSADYLHVDLIDGKFCGKKNFKLKKLEKLLENSTKPLDVHLMCKKPMEVVPYIYDLNIENITIHCELLGVEDYIKALLQLGFKVGLAVNPETDVSELIPYLSMIEVVLIMSVNPGRGGQEFIESTYEKIKKLRELRRDKCLFFNISVDGGINDTHIEKLRELDVDRIVSGSYICKSDDYEAQIIKLR